MPPTRLTWALASAAVQAGGLVETLGTMAKSVSVGNAARTGMFSALLAADGFDGPPRALEGERGYLRVAADAPNIAPLAQELGTRWEVLNNTYKPYPCGVVLNPVIEACLALSSDPRLAGDGLQSIRSSVLVGHPLLRQRTDRPGITTGRQSQVSAQHAVPVALSRGRAGLEDFLIWPCRITGCAGLASAWHSRMTPVIQSMPWRYVWSWVMAACWSSTSTQQGVRVRGRSRIRTWKPNCVNCANTAAPMWTLHA